MGEQNEQATKPGSAVDGTPGKPQGQKPMAPPDKADTTIDPEENGRKSRDQGLEKKKASDSDEAADDEADDTADRGDDEGEDLDSDDPVDGSDDDEDERPSV